MTVQQQTHDIRMFVLVQAVARATQTHGRHQTQPAASLEETAVQLTTSCFWESKRGVCSAPPLLPLRLHHFHLHLCPSIYHSSTPLSIHLLPSLSQCLSFRRYQPPLSRSLSTPTQLHSFTCRYLSGWTNRLPRWCSRGNNKQVNMGGARTPRLCNNVQNTPSYVGHRFGFMLFFKGVFSVRGFKVTEGIFLES